MFLATVPANELNFELFFFKKIEILHCGQWENEKLPNILEMGSRRAKRGEIWDSWVVSNIYVGYLLCLSV